METNEWRDPVNDPLRFGEVVLLALTTPSGTNLRRPGMLAAPMSQPDGWWWLDLVGRSVEFGPMYAYVPAGDELEVVGWWPLPDHPRGF